MNNTAIRILWLAAIIAAISACGIPTTQFIGAPNGDGVFGFRTPPMVTFAHNAIDNSTENFLGYELYYKFYQHLPEPNQGGFGSDLIVFAEAAPGSGKSTVVAQGFRRIFEAGDSIGNLPLISIDSADSASDFDVVVYFPDQPSVNSPDPAVAVFLGSTVQLVRDPNAAAILSERTFESDDLSIDPNDLDLPVGIPPTDAVIHMAVVILAYGIDYTGGNFDTLYSDPFMVEQPLEIILQ